MKLLQPKQHQQNKEKEDALKRIRTAELNREYEDKLHLLNTLTTDFEHALEAQKNTYAQEKEAHALWRSDAQAEVSELEARKIAALLPIVERENDVTLKEEKLREGLFILEQAKAELEEEKGLMYKRLDEVGERETEVKQLQNSLVLQKNGNDMQAENIRTQSKQLSVTLEELAKASTERERDYNKRKATLDARENSLEVQDKLLSDRHTDLTNRERALADRYQTLQRTINRLKK